MRLADIAARFGGELLGAGNIEITQIAPLDRAGPGQIAFLSSPKHRRLLETTGASAVIVGREERDATSRPRIVCDNPYAYFARISALLNPLPSHSSGIHPSAAVAPTALIAMSASIGPHVHIGGRVVVGERTVIEAGCAVGEGTTIGDDVHLYANVSVYHRCAIGHRVTLHSGAVIGSDGFGLAMDAGRWLKIPQVGRVVLGDDVEIGANTTVDRGTLDDTVIEEGVKIDNLVQIAHNCRIGAHTAIAACVGIAGSTRIGRYCRIAGAAMIQGHIEICDDVTVSAATAVMKSITRPGTYTSVYPFQEHQEWIRNAAHIRHLDQMAKRIQALEKRLQALPDGGS